MLAAPVEVFASDFNAHSAPALVLVIDLRMRSVVAQVTSVVGCNRQPSARRAVEPRITLSLRFAPAGTAGADRPRTISCRAPGHHSP
jgi:hypothetical protein